MTFIIFLIILVISAWLFTELVIPAFSSKPFFPLTRKLFNRNETPPTKKKNATINEEIKIATDALARAEIEYAKLKKMSKQGKKDAKKGLQFAESAYRKAFKKLETLRKVNID